MFILICSALKRKQIPFHLTNFKVLQTNNPFVQIKSEGRSLNYTVIQLVSLALQHCVARGAGSTVLQLVSVAPQH